MSEFKLFKNAVEAKIAQLMEGEVFTVDLDKDKLWETYLGSFPEGTNPIYIERTEHDCNCCKQFIKGVGGMVSSSMDTVWNVEGLPSHYQAVADALHNLVSNAEIRNKYLTKETRYGTSLTRTEQGLEFDHFAVSLPKHLVVNSELGKTLSHSRADYEVLLRSVEEITLDAANTVLELIEQGSLYRGEEHKDIVKKLIQVSSKYQKAKNKTQYLWETSVKLKGAGRIRSTVIGTLLTDISEGVALETAVKKFESKVAPTNYKRPTALVTKGMIKKAEQKVVELGIEDSLQRRYARAEDLTINNVIFADRSARKSMNVFDEMAAETTTKPNLDKVEEIDVATFISNIIPKAEKIELFVDNGMASRMVSLIAPEVASSPNILKWGNNFSWAYEGEVTDSIKERVKAAGGAVEGVLRTSLAWFNGDDLDIHIIEPNGNKIYFGNKVSTSSGTLDIDMNAGRKRNSVNPVENVIWTRKKDMPKGEYTVKVHNFSKRDTKNVGFELELECGGESTTFVYEKGVKAGEHVTAVRFLWDGETAKVLDSLPSTTRTKEIWGINTQNYVPVKMVMNSPNHWDGEETGNKHLFFMLEGCQNQDKARGFFNEFLQGDLTEHRKVFEVLGSKLKAEPTEDQLSGVGFSSTQRGSALFKVSGSFNRVVKVNF